MRARCLLPCFPCTCLPRQFLLIMIRLMLMYRPANSLVELVVMGRWALEAFHPSWYLDDRMMAALRKLCLPFSPLGQKT